MAVRIVGTLILISILGASMATAPVSSLPAGERGNGVYTVALERPAFGPDEHIRAQLSVTNAGRSHIMLSSLSWRTSIYEVDAREERLVYSEVIYRDVHRDDVVAPGGMLILTPFSNVWNQRMPDGSLASPGTYALRVEFGVVEKVLLEQQFVLTPLSAVVEPSESQSSFAVRPGPMVEDGGSIALASTGGSAGYGALCCRSEDASYTWYYNNDREPPLGLVQDQVELAFLNWSQVLPAHLSTIRGGDVSVRAFDLDDGIDVVDWCAPLDDCRTAGLSHGVVGLARCQDSGTSILECDMMLNGTLPWSIDGSPVPNVEFDVRSLVVHEAGHWLGLHDLYDPGDEFYEPWMGMNNLPHIMYGRSEPGLKRNLNWGDKSGVSYLYPDTVKGPTLLGYETAGADAVILDVGNDGDDDVLFAAVDDPSGDNTIKYRIGFNVDEDGRPGIWSQIRTAFSGIGSETDGLAVAAGGIDADVRKDIIFAWLDDPSGDNTAYYRICWNLQTNGNTASCSATKTVGGGGIGSEQDGAAACLTQIDGSGGLDLVIAWIDDVPFGVNTIYYRIGWNLDSAGDPASWSSTFTAGFGDDLGTTNAGLGLVCANVDESSSFDFVFGWVDVPLIGQNKMYWRLGHDVSSTGSPSGWENIKAGPGMDLGIGAQTQGFGLAGADIDLQGTADLMFFYVDNPSGGNSFYYRDEWNTRWMSHG